MKKTSNIFRYSLPESPYDIDWHRKTFQLSPAVYAQSLFEFGDDCASLGNGLEMQLQKQEAGKDIVWRKVNGESPAAAYAFALFPRHEEGYVPAPLTRAQMAMHERAVELYKREATNDKGLCLNAYLNEAAVRCVDPIAFDMMIDAGADVAFAHDNQKTSGALGNFPISCAFNALLNSNPVAFIYLSRKDPDSAKRMTEGIFQSQYMKTLLVDPIADMLAGFNAALSGLHCLVAIEESRGLRWSNQSLSFRLEVILAYLQKCSAHGLAWSEEKIGFLLGTRGSKLEGSDSMKELPKQPGGIRFEIFNLFPRDETKRVILAALEVHCRPVVETFINQLTHLQAERQLTSIESRFMGIHTALAAMVTLREGCSFDMNRFEQTFKLIQYAGLLEVEGREGAFRNQNPAMHQLALHGGSRTLEVLRFLLEEGLLDDCFNKLSKEPIDLLEGAMLKEQWMGVVRSFKAKTAAHEALSSLSAGTGTSKRTV